MLWSRRKPHNYGRVLPTHRWQGLTLRQRFWRAVKPWLALAAGVAVVAGFAVSLLRRRPAPSQ